MYVLSAGGPVIGAALGLGVGLGLGIVLAAQMKKAEQVIGALRKTLDDHREELAEDSILIDTKAAYQKERARHHFWGHIIAYGFMAMSIGIMYLGYSDLPQAAQGLIMNDFSGFWSKMTSGSLPSSWEKSLILIGIGLVFFLASLHSVFHVQRKYGSPLRV
jgi:ABC-type antimicrobial peptide transport system permease subunit